MNKKIIPLILILFFSSQSYAKEAVGVITALKGDAEIFRKDENKKEPAVEKASVYLNDVIETKDGTRLKILFNDDSILRMGPNSQMEINEHVYSPQTDTRQAVYKVAKGTVRALVAKSFSGAGSKFEIRTPTAVAASRDTAFIVWATGDSGVLSLEGRVEVSNNGVSGSVMLLPNMMTTIGANNAPVVAIKASASQIKALIQATEINESPAQAKVKINIESDKGGGTKKFAISLDGKKIELPAALLPALEKISRPLINQLRREGIDFVLKPVEGTSRIGGVINAVPVTATESLTPTKVPINLKITLPQKK